MITALVGLAFACITYPDPTALQPCQRHRTWRGGRQWWTNSSGSPRLMPAWSFKFVALPRERAIFVWRARTT